MKKRNLTKALHASYAETERLRNILLNCMGGANLVDLGNGNSICLYLEVERRQWTEVVSFGLREHKRGQD